MNKYFAEFIGTLLLVLLACGSAVLAGPAIGVLGIGLCFGLILLCLCYCIGNISGCHVNPAVSFAMLLAGRMSGRDFCGYVVAQLPSALWPVPVFLHGLWPSRPAIISRHHPGVADLAANVVQPGATQGMALLAEVLLTATFVLVILGATDSKKGFGNFAGLAIGLALGLVNIVGIPVDNCSVNPARSFGPAVWSPGAWPDFWIMVVGPLAGAALAVVIWRIMTASNTCKGASCDA